MAASPCGQASGMISAFDVWSSAEQTAGVALRTVVVYVLALVAVRIAGRRTLAQFSAYDIVVTVAAGTVIGSTALPPQPAVSDGVTVLVTLLALQVAIGALRQRSTLVRGMVDFAPRAIVRDGRVDPSQHPTSAQLTASDVRSLLRQQGVTDLPDVRLAVLEPTGKVSLLQVNDDTGELFKI